MNPTVYNYSIEHGDEKFGKFITQTEAENFLKTWSWEQDRTLMNRWRIFLSAEMLYATIVRKKGGEEPKDAELLPKGECVKKNDDLTANFFTEHFSML